MQDNFDQTYEIANARFKAGIANYLDVLDAQRSLFSTQQGILNLELQKLTSQVELYQALGGGANLNVPVAIPVSQYTNLAQIASLPAKNNPEAQAAYAVEAASSARVVSVAEAIAIKRNQTPDIMIFEPTAIVDLDRDNNADAAVGILTEEATVEQVPVTQIIEP